ncbi:hypothetical protein WMF37_51390 [Sorangium sp. So ce291]|uniref:hypothetical protein n=1 Tax=Sorangium sp. So ce291 TaxID=3133294 RepID=UPI003F5E9208
MDGTSRLLVVEPPAPAPAARGNVVLDWTLTFSDINELANTGGRERTEAEHRAPLEAAWRCGQHARGDAELLSGLRGGAGLSRPLTTATHPPYRGAPP